MAGKRRNGSVDLLRGMAAVGIVWFHASAPYGEMALSGLTVFFLLLVVLSPGPQMPFGQLVASRVNRLIRPWLAWSAIFAFAKAAQALLARVPLSEEFEPWMLLTGPGLHLWFLPFSFACVVALALVERDVDLRTASAFAVLLALCVVALPVATSLKLASGSHPLPEWAAAIAPIILAFALRSANGSVSRQGWVLAATLLSFVLDSWMHPGAPIAVPLGLIFTLIALQAPLPDSPALRWISMISMPIYLIHPIFLSLPDIGSMAQYPALFAVVIICLCALTGMAIRQIGLASKLL